MYNLIVGAIDGRIDSSRVLEHTDEPARQFATTDAGSLNFPRLTTMPTLLMPERGGDVSQQGLLGRIEIVTHLDREYRFKFSPTPGIPSIPMQAIEAEAAQLRITDWEFQRTHWAVKEADPYWILQHAIQATPGRAAFQIPREPRQHDLVAVMMPFESGYTPVYESIKAAAADAGLQAVRVDNIWDNSAIMDDVVNLLHRARVVVSDLSGKNANVFYETGIAHAWNRDTVLITRSADDVPFDLRHLRYLHYLPNTEGCEKLKVDLGERLAKIVQ